MAPSGSKSSKAGKRAETAEKEKENGIPRPPGSTACTIFRFIFDVAVGSIKLILLCGSCLWAYRIRLVGVPVYGYMIHGFDPTFNFTAARYLARKGWYEFFRWYDY